MNSSSEHCTPTRRRSLLSFAQNLTRFPNVAARRKLSRLLKQRRRVRRW
jgi:hypothetical protein